MLSSTALGRAALLDQQRAALLFDPAQQLAEADTRAQRRYHDTVIVPSCVHGNSSVQLSELYSWLASASIAAWLSGLDEAR